LPTLEPIDVMTCAMFSNLCPRLFAKNGRHADDIPRHGSMYVQTDALKTDLEISVRSMVAVMTARTKLAIHAL
jgi:hypothetical protein